MLGRGGRFEPLAVGPADPRRPARRSSRNANLPIGITREAAFHEGCLKLDVGDWLMFYTDGLLEARNENGQEYGLARMLGDLHRLAPVSPMVLKNGLLTRLAGFVSPRRLDQDDITLIALVIRDLPAADKPIVRMAPELEKLMNRPPRT